jgi:hypothetical protein
VVIPCLIANRYVAGASDLSPGNTLMWFASRLTDIELGAMQGAVLWLVKR